MAGEFDQLIASADVGGEAAPCGIITPTYNACSGAAPAAAAPIMEAKAVTPSQMMNGGRLEATVDNARKIGLG